MLLMNDPDSGGVKWVPGSVLETSLSVHDCLYVTFQVCIVKKVKSYYSDATKVNTCAPAYTQFKGINVLG